MAIQQVDNLLQQTQAESLLGSFLQSEYVARGARGTGGLSLLGLCSRAQLGWWRYCSDLGPPGSQLVLRHCPCLRLWAADMPLLRPMASSCSAVSLGPGQFKPVFCYLNPSSPVTASSLCRRSVWMLQASTHYPCGSLTGGWGRWGGLYCSLPVQVPALWRVDPEFGPSAPIVPVPLSGLFSIAQPEPGVLFSSSMGGLWHPVLDIKVKWLWATQFLPFGICFLH